MEEFPNAKRDTLMLGRERDRVRRCIERAEREERCLNQHVPRKDKKSDPFSEARPATPHSKHDVGMSMESARCNLNPVHPPPDDLVVEDDLQASTLTEDRWSELRSNASVLHHRVVCRDCYAFCRLCASMLETVERSQTLLTRHASESSCMQNNQVT